MSKLCEPRIERWTTPHLRKNMCRRACARTQNARPECRRNALDRCQGNETLSVCFLQSAPRAPVRKGIPKRINDVLGRTAFGPARQPFTCCRPHLGHPVVQAPQRKSEGARPVLGFRRLLVTARNPDRGTVARTIRRLLRERGAGKSICPSDAARAIAGEDFRRWMPLVRSVTGELVVGGEVVVTQKGKLVDLASARGPIRISAASKAKTSYVDAYRNIDFRAHPELYRVGRGEEGVLVAEPYKSELLPLWRFRTPEVAKESAQALLAAFVRYRKARDFVGMDMARKYLQMGFTRARRYANHSSGRKYAARDVTTARRDRAQLPEAPDLSKAAAAQIFYEVWQRVEQDRTYAAWRQRQRTKVGRTRAPG